ncbi:MAG: hypothetical protein R3E14_12690 [Erythrobacter sp.]
MIALAGGARAVNRYVLALFSKDIAWRLVTVAAFGILVGMGQSAGIGAVLPIIATAAVACAVWQVVRLRVRGTSLAQPSRASLDHAYLSGSATIAVSMLAVVALGTLDVIVVGAWVSPDAAAAYFPANRLALLAAFATLPIQMVVEQRFAASLAVDDRAGGQRSANAATALQFVLCAPLGAATVIGFPFYAGLFPTATATSFQVLVVLVAGTVLGSLFGMAGSILLMSGHQAPFARVNFVCACLAALILALVASYGSLTSIAFAIAGVELLRKAILAVMAYRRTGLLPFAKVGL